MRHGNAHRKLGRTSAHRTAMFANMAASLIKHLKKPAKCKKKYESIHKVLKKICLSLDETA